MQELELVGNLRDKFGKGSARRLRVSGMIPAVLYSGGRTTTISLSQREVIKLIGTGASENVIFQLNIQGEAKKERKVMVKDLQFDPLKGTLLHADFYEVQMDKEVTIKVPIALIGRAAKVEEKQAMVELLLRELEVQCLPGAIPANIEFDISGLEVSDVVHVKDIKVPQGLKVLNEPRETFLTVSSRRVEEKVAVEEAAEAKEEKEEVKEEE